MKTWVKSFALEEWLHILQRGTSVISEYMQKASISVQRVSKVKGKPPCSGIKTRPKSRQVVFVCLVHEQTMTFIQKQVQSILLKFFGKKSPKIGNFLTWKKCKKEVCQLCESNTHTCSFCCLQRWVFWGRTHPAFSWMQMPPGGSDC